MRNTDYKPPFVWFGGKSAVAETIWAAFGDVDNYVEPFFGSGAVTGRRAFARARSKRVRKRAGRRCSGWRVSTCR